MNIHNQPDAMSDLWICEELFLLVIDDAGKPESIMLNLPLGMAAAVVADTTTAAKVELIAAGRSGDANPKVVVIDETPTGDPVLDIPLARMISKNGRPLRNTIEDCKVDPTRAVVDRLVARGIIEHQPSRAFGIVSAKYPTLDPRAERTIRSRLEAGMRGAEVSTGDATLLAIVEGLSISRNVFRSLWDEIGGRAFRTRLAEITADLPYGKAVDYNVQTQWAVVAAIAAT